MTPTPKKPAPQGTTFTSPLRKPAPLAEFLLGLSYPHPSDAYRLMLEIMRHGGALEFVHDNAGDLVPAADGGYGIRTLGETLAPKERADALLDAARDLEHQNGPGPSRATYRGFGSDKPHLVPLTWQDASAELLFRGRVNVATVRKGKAIWVPLSALEGDPERPRPASREIPWVGVDLARDDAAVVQFPREHELKYVPLEPDPPEALYRAHGEITREAVQRTAKQIFNLDP